MRAAFDLTVGRVEKNKQSKAVDISDSFLSSIVTVLELRQCRHASLAPVGIYRDDAKPVKILQSINDAEIKMPGINTHRHVTKLNKKQNKKQKEPS